MARTTQQVRDAWSPACAAKAVSLVDAYTALDRCFKVHDYAPKSGQTWGYNCRRITGGSGYSLHAYDPGERFTFWSGVAVTTAIAVDINSLANPYGKRLVTDMPRPMVDAICAIRTVDGLQVWFWGGYYSNNKDAMHFEIKLSPAELARGIDWATVPSVEEDEMTPEDWEKMEALIDAKLTAYVGKPYAEGLTANKILTEKVGETYVDGIKVIREEIANLDVPRKTPVADG